MLTRLATERTTRVARSLIGGGNGRRALDLDVDACATRRNVRCRFSLFSRHVRVGLFERRVVNLFLVWEF